MRGLLPLRLNRKNKEYRFKIGDIIRYRYHGGLDILYIGLIVGFDERKERYYISWLGNYPPWWIKSVYRCVDTVDVTSHIEKYASIEVIK
jgi:hypothetical protein